MAKNPLARRLTEAHRLAQARLGAATVRQVVTVWPLLDPLALDSTFARWLSAVSTIVTGARTSSAQLAGQYLELFRGIELDNAAPFVPVLATEVPIKALATSMLVTGPVTVKSNLSRGRPLREALDTAMTYSARSGMRHALDGGRQTITDTIRKDRDATGYERVASGNACAYCSDLDGIQFATDEVFAAHDGCHCTAEPVFG